MSQSMPDKDLEGPYIVWENYGYEGWKPKSYKDLATALTTPRYNELQK